MLRYIFYIYFVCANNADDDERREKKIRTSFQVRLMLLLLVDAKENVIKNLFMAANEISLNPSFAFFLHIRFDKRAQSARCVLLSRSSAVTVLRRWLWYSNVWLLSFAAEHANIDEMKSTGFLECLAGSNNRHNVKRFKSMSCVGTRTFHRTLGHRTQINRFEWYIVTADIHSTARNRETRKSEANELSAIECEWMCDARPRWRAPSVR